MDSILLDFVSIVKTYVFLFLTDSLMFHKWENALSLDQYSWGYRSDMKTSDVMSIADLIESVVSTVSCGGKTKAFY